MQCSAQLATLLTHRIWVMSQYMLCRASSFMICEAHAHSACMLHRTFTCVSNKSIEVWLTALWRSTACVSAVCADFTVCHLHPPTTTSSKLPSSRLRCLCPSLAGRAPRCSARLLRGRGTTQKPPSLLRTSWRRACRLAIRPTRRPARWASIAALDSVNCAQV